MLRGQGELLVGGLSWSVEGAGGGGLSWSVEGAGGPELPPTVDT